MLEIQLSTDQLNQLKENEGKIISFHGFLTATHVRSNTLAATKKLRKRTNRITALFEIECNAPTIDDRIIFVDIEQGREILFDLSVTFRLENIHLHEHLWIIEMKTSNDGQQIRQKYTDDTNRQIDSLNIAIMFGRWMLDMNQWDQSQKYFERLLIDPNGEDLAWVDYSLGEVSHLKGEWIVARKHYDRAYEQMINSKPARIKDSAHILAGIGQHLGLEGNFEEARDFHERALAIQKEYYSSDHANISNSLHFVGNILQR
jgi:tetratricopeptide (TPR) repeat protein